MTVANASVYPVATHWIVSSEVWNSTDSLLIATSTTVMSKMDMMAPSTTPEPTASNLRSSPAPGDPPVLIRSPFPLSLMGFRSRQDRRERVEQVFALLVGE